MADRWYRTHQFAVLAGVTVRTLRHYDRIGLLSPRRTESGYRMYRMRDLERLEHIVALKFLGIPLRQIQLLLEDDALELAGALRVQRRILEEKRRLLDTAISAIRQAEQQPDAARLKQIIEVLTMENNPDWMMKYHSEEGAAKIAARREEWTPEKQVVWSRQWSELIAEAEAAMGEDIASPRVQALAARWMELVEGFTGGDPEVTKGVARLWSDYQNWPEGPKQQAGGFYKPQVWAFMQKAIELRKKTK